MRNEFINRVKDKLHDIVREAILDGQDAIYHEGERIGVDFYKDGYLVVGFDEECRPTPNVLECIKAAASDIDWRSINDEINEWCD